MKLICALLLSAFSCLSFAKADSLLDMNPDCISQARVEQFARHYPIFRGINGAVCAASDPTHFRILQVLSLIEDIKLSGPNTASSDDLITPLLPDSWSQYLSQRVNQFKIEDQTDNRCTESVVAFVMVPLTENGLMHLCPRFFDTNQLSLGEAMMALMHEARHFDPGYELHVPCVANHRSGLVLRGCDESIRAQGSYAVTVEVLAKLSAQGENVHPVMREAARASAISFALNVFNQTPNIERQERPVVLTQDGKMVVLGKDKLLSAFENVDGSLITKRVVGGFTFLSPSSGAKQTVTSSLKFTNSEDSTDVIRDTYNRFSPAERARVRGVHYGQINFIMTEDKILAICNWSGNSLQSSDQLLKVKTQGAKFKAIIYDQGFNQESDTVKLMSANGKWADLVCHDGGAVTLSAWRNPNVKSVGKVMKIDNKLYSISMSGNLLERSVNPAASQASSSWTQNQMIGNQPIIDFLSFDWIRFFDER